MSTTFAYAKINARIMPLDRGDLYEHPLEEAFAENGLGEVTGGGTMQSESGEIAYCGIDLDLVDLKKAVPFLCQFLAERGAPKGSQLEYESNGERVTVAFGASEGLAVYLNGTDLPDEVYSGCDANFVYQEFIRLLGDRGSVLGHWQGPTETALYLYGPSADEMRSRIAGFMSEYPLCQRARIERIA